MITLSENASNVALDAVARLMDGGLLELLDGSGQVVAELHLSSPAAEAAADSALMLSRIDDGIAIKSANAETARIVGPDGVEVLVCDVGDERSSAVIKLSATEIPIGFPVRITSFWLVMP